MVEPGDTSLRPFPITSGDLPEETLRANLKAADVSVADSLDT